jgi:hypothetical protein
MVLFVSKDIVYANAGAAFFEELPSGFHVVPMKNVSADIIHEELYFDTCVNEDPDVALIKAKYYLKSSYDINKDLTLAFPYVDYSKAADNNVSVYTEKAQFKNIQILFDGKTIKSEVRLLPKVSPEILSGKGSSFENILSLLNDSFNNNTDDIQKKFQSSESESLFRSNGVIGVILFNVNLKAKAYHTLEVSLYQEPSMSRIQGEKPINYMYYYFLDPAKCWNSFNNLDITIKIPHEYHIKDSNLKLKNAGSDTYKFHSDKLPVGNFQFTVRSDESFSGWRVIIIAFFSIVIGIIAILAFLVFRIVKALKKAKTSKA